MLRAADISPCGRFRYRLARRWAAGPALVFIMLNPSKADGDIDDPTVRKCIGFAKRLGYSGVEIVNLFAYRATDPADLKRAGYPVGDENDAAIMAAVMLAVIFGKPVVCAWGAHARSTEGQQRVRQVMELLRFVKADAKALKLSDDRTPWHPLMLSYDSQLVDL